jgi:uncharacterized protein
MTKEIWINLPVKDVAAAKAFFEKIGFTPNEKHSSAAMAAFSVGEKAMSVLFVAAETFREFTKSEISDARAGAEVLISFDAASRDEVDETARRVFDAGGTIFGEPSEIQGWMYGFGFSDPNGHRWNMVFMDFSKLP